jgi:hypothetical protein
VGSRGIEGVTEVGLLDDLTEDGEIVAVTPVVCVRGAVGPTGLRARERIDGRRYRNVE